MSRILEIYAEEEGTKFKRLGLGEKISIVSRKKENLVHKSKS
jgi:hypothetical protein